MVPAAFHRTLCPSVGWGGVGWYTPGAAAPRCTGRAGSRAGAAARCGPRRWCQTRRSGPAALMATAWKCRVVAGGSPWHCIYTRAIHPCQLASSLERHHAHHGPGERTGSGTEALTRRLSTHLPLPLLLDVGGHEDQVLPLGQQGGRLARWQCSLWRGVPAGAWAGDSGQQVVTSHAQEPPLLSGMKSRVEEWLGLEAIMGR